MCGFVGLVQRRVRRKQDELVTNLRNSARIISHRGPDDAQEWVAEDASAGFGFRRLSIRDLSSAGRQPMSSRCSRYTMVFNGEIYNHLDIRKELETVFASEWDGHSDSETLLIAISLWGLEKTLSVIDGMFAIALWDDREKKLYLVRDRFGEKPLYYTHQEDTLYFASELKALSPLGASVGGIDKGAVITFFRLRYIPAPKTIYNNVYKVMPGEILVYDQGATGGVSTKKYWDSLHEAYRLPKHHPNHRLTDLGLAGLLTTLQPGRDLRICFRPPAVTAVPRTSRYLRLLSPLRCSSPASVIAVRSRERISSLLSVFSCSSPISVT